MADVTSKKKIPNKMLLIVIALVLGAGGAFLFTRKAGTSDKKGKKNKKHQIERVEPGPKVDLGEFLVNLSGGSDHYLKASITVALTKGSSEEKFKEEIPVVKDAVVAALSHRRIEEQQSTKGMSRLKEELKGQINKALGDEAIVQVYFTSFMTQ